jgi:hypothetical protein
MPVRRRAGRKHHVDRSAVAVEARHTFIICPRRRRALRGFNLQPVRHVLVARCTRSRSSRFELHAIAAALAQVVEVGRHVPLLVARGADVLEDRSIDARLGTRSVVYRRRSAAAATGALVPS